MKKCIFKEHFGGDITSLRVKTIVIILQLC